MKATFRWVRGAQLVLEVKGAGSVAYVIQEESDEPPCYTAAVYVMTSPPGEIGAAMANGGEVKAHGAELVGVFDSEPEARAACERHAKYQFGAQPPGAELAALAEPEADTDASA